MKKNNLLLLTSIMVLSGCTHIGKNSDSDSYSVSQIPDTIGLIPEEVLNADVTIDLLTYVEGQSGTINDIGKPSMQPDYLIGSELARYAGAAKAFKSLAPKVKINVIYCSIDEYNPLIVSYNQQKGHVPHIMHPVDNFYDMVEQGIVTDLSIYENSEYFQSFNSMYMDNVTFNDFVAAFPTHIAPYGMFVNKDILRENDIISTSDTDYINWVNSLTLDKYLDACEKTYSAGKNAAFANMTDIMGSFIYEDLYLNYVNEEEHVIDFTNAGVEKLIDIENELYKYSVFAYPREGNYGKEDDGFGNSDFARWNVTSRFAKGGYTFNPEMPWNIGLVSQEAYKAYNNHEITNLPDIDFIPYPKADANTDFVIGNAVGGLSIGNLCPIGQECDARAKLERDVAAYFTMFMINDPRAIKAEAAQKYLSNTDASDPNEKFSTGYVTLPLQERDFRFSWQDDQEVVNEVGDLFIKYDNPYLYQLALYLKNYPLYLTNNEDPDLDNYSNVKYGFATILDYLNNKTNRVVNYRSIPQMIQEGTEVVDIMERWNDRYEIYGLGSELYASSLKADLADIEAYVNESTQTAYDYLQECIDNYY